MHRVLLTATQAARIDRQAREGLGIQTLVLMENAGRGIAEAAQELLASTGRARVAIFCGRGNNAGDGFVAARHLLTCGYIPDIFLLAPQHFSAEINALTQIQGAAEANLAILKKLTYRFFEVKNAGVLKSINLNKYSLIIDALLGIGLQGKVRGLFKEAISRINKSAAPIIAVDIPSGLNATTGRVEGCAVRAALTVTFIAKKKGLVIGRGPEYCGRIIVKDLGLPFKNLIRRFRR